MVKKLYCLGCNREINHVGRCLACNVQEKRRREAQEALSKQEA